jgi:hypothetical protein
MKGKSSNSLTRIAARLTISYFWEAATTRGSFNSSSVQINLFLIGTLVIPTSNSAAMIFWSSSSVRSSWNSSLALGNFQLNLRMTSGKQKALSLDESHCQGAVATLNFSLQNLILYLVALQSRSGARQQHPADIGEYYLASKAVDERLSDLVFEFPYLLTQRNLGFIIAFSSPTETTGFDVSNKIFQLMNFQIANHIIYR